MRELLYREGRGPHVCEAQGLCPVLRVSREGAKPGCFDFIYLISEAMENKENNGIKLKIKNA
jgi:hypothetical protein